MQRLTECQIKLKKAILDNIGERQKSMYYLANLATDPDHQGKGYGSALVKSFTARVSCLLAR
jgi:predicted N-acetyltransferase YhbS